MKLERINENQIRCTLNKNDLLSRHLKLSELAYGTEKAKALFREMMAQASEELGFEADDIPLVIEATPVSSDCIVLIITKVEDPDELDTRFSRFASLAGQIQGEGESHDGDADSIDEKSYVGADEILNLFKRIKEGLESSLAASAQSETASKPAQEAEHSPQEAVPAKNIEITRLFSFQSLPALSDLADVLHHKYSGVNSLYKNPATGIYYLLMNNKHQSPENFNRICNISTEYGTCEKYSETMGAYFDEHYDCLIKNKAIQVLSEL